mgnify:CR=1 FL=1
MLKNVEKMTKNYSPNFNPVKRKKNRIKYLIFHYTGMKSDKLAIKKLINKNSNVSCHYYITISGKIIQMVPDLYIAWHAGKSRWKRDVSLNENSIGIEISNPGHANGYRSFSKSQIKSLVVLAKILLKKYKIRGKNILGHSDIAPLRKKDPGEKFPWRYLANKKIGIWHKIDEKKLKKIRNKKITKNEILKFIKYLNKIGYFVKNLSKNKKFKLVKSFQRRFRQKLVNGKIDRECLIIGEKLSKLS